MMDTLSCKRHNTNFPSETWDLKTILSLSERQVERRRGTVKGTEREGVCLCLAERMASQVVLMTAGSIHTGRIFRRSSVAAASLSCRQLFHNQYADDGPSVDENKIITGDENHHEISRRK